MSRLDEKTLETARVHGTLANKPSQKEPFKEKVYASMHAVVPSKRLGNYPQYLKPTEEMYDILDLSRFSRWT